MTPTTPFTPATRSPLLTPVSLGQIDLPNRVVMAPLTRMRAGPGAVPTPLMALQYAQRAAAGLIVTEATQVEPRGQGYPDTPGIFTDAQAQGWTRITNAVHAVGGRIVLQLWHVGRISHSSFQPGGLPPIAPSAIAPEGTTLTAQWVDTPYEVPRALRTDEIPDLVRAYADAARRARDAGFDGVEVHGANGYLLDQFLEDGTNIRDDEYGRTVEGRARLLLEVVDAVTEVWGPGRVGVRLSPWSTFNSMRDSDPKHHFGYAISQLSQRRIAYLHLIEPHAKDAESADPPAAPTPSPLAELGHLFDGPVVSAGGYTPRTAELAVAEGGAAAIAFGRLFIANPDLPVRIALGAELNRYDRSTFYGGDARGYIDYPILNSFGGSAVPSAANSS